MSIEDVSRQLGELSAELKAKFEAVTDQFKAIDERFKGIDQKFNGIDERFNGIDQKFDRLGTKMDQGFNDSKIRDEQLLGLTRFGLEADEVLRDAMVRRFDESDRRNDEQIGLLKEVTRHLSSHK